MPLLSGSGEAAEAPPNGGENPTQNQNNEDRNSQSSFPIMLKVCKIINLFRIGEFRKLINDLEIN